MKKLIIIMMMVVCGLVTAKPNYFLSEGSYIDAEEVTVTDSGTTNSFADYVDNSGTDLTTVSNQFLLKDGGVAGSLTVSNLNLKTAVIRVDEAGDQININGINRFYIRDILCSNLIVLSTNPWVFAVNTVFSNDVKFIGEVGALITGGEDISTSSLGGGAGGDIKTAGGDVYTGASLASESGGGSIRTAGGYINTYGGYIDFQKQVAPGEFFGLFLNNNIISNVFVVSTTNNYMQFNCGNDTYTIGIR